MPAALTTSPTSCAARISTRKMCSSTMNTRGAPRKTVCTPLRLIQRRSPSAAELSLRTPSPKRTAMRRSPPMKHLPRTPRRLPSQRTTSSALTPPPKRQLQRRRKTYSPSPLQKRLQANPPMRTMHSASPQMRIYSQRRRKLPHQGAWDLTYSAAAMTRELRSLPGRSPIYS